MVKHHTVLCPLNITFLLDCIVQCLSNFLIGFLWGRVSKLEETNRDLKEGMRLVCAERFEILKILSQLYKK